MVRKDFLLLFFIALLVRLSFFFIVSQQPLRFYSNSDTYNYEHIAVNLIKYGKFSNDTQLPLTPNLYRTPIYPFFIAGTYLITNHSAYAVILLQILLGSLAAALMPMLADSLNLSRHIGWIAGIIMAIDPLITLTTYQMITETLFLIFLIPTVILLALYFKTKNFYWLGGSAVFLALTTLVRPISIYLPFVLIPLFFITGRKDGGRIWKGALLFFAINFLVTNSWAFRNYYVSNIWTISAISSQNLLYYRARDVIAVEENLSESEAYSELKQYIQAEVTSQNLSPAQEIHLMNSKAIDVFRQYPVTTIKVHLKGFFKVLANPGFNLICIMLDRHELQFDAQDNVVGCTSDENAGFITQTIDKLAQMDWLEKLVSALEMILLGVLYLGAALGSWKLVKEKQWYLLFFLLILVAYFSLLASGGESVARFRIPMIPFLAILAGIGFSKSYLSLKES